MDLDQAAKAYAFLEVTWLSLVGEKLPISLSIGLDPDTALKYAKRILDARDFKAEAQKIMKERFHRTEKKWWQFWKGA